MEDLIRQVSEMKMDQEQRTIRALTKENQMLRWQLVGSLQLQRDVRAFVFQVTEVFNRIKVVLDDLDIKTRAAEKDWLANWRIYTERIDCGQFTHPQWI